MISLFHARAVPAAVIAIGFAVLARLMGAVTDGGALAGILAAFVWMIAAGSAGFAPLLAVFLLTAFTTRLGWRRKQGLGIAERSGGRTASQVVANLGSSTLCALAVCCFPAYAGILLPAAAAALAEAAADTVSSEVGQGIASRAYLVTDLHSVPVGTNGAISIAGTTAGVLAAFLVAWIAAAFRVVGWAWVPAIAVAAIGGMLLDSILGATLENAGRLDNNAVNFLSTIFAADVLLVVGLALQRF